MKNECWWGCTYTQPAFSFETTWTSLTLSRSGGSNCYKYMQQQPCHPHNHLQLIIIIITSPSNHTSIIDMSWSYSSSDLTAGCCLMDKTRTRTRIRTRNEAKTFVVRDLDNLFVLLTENAERIRWNTSIQTWILDFRVLFSVDNKI